MARLVLVEDEPDIATLVATKFRNAGYDVSMAMDGESGLALIIASAPDLVLLDVMMPKMDGYKVCEAIRSHFDGTARPLVILLSARSQFADRERGFEAGCDDYIVKPFRPADLLTRVTELLERQGRE